MQCPACGAADLRLGLSCARCGQQAPLVTGPPGFMLPQKLELTGPQMAAVMMATFAATVAAIFSLFLLMFNQWLADLVEDIGGAFGVVLLIAILVGPGTVVGTLLYRYFLAKNLNAIANGQQAPSPLISSRQESP